MKTKKAATIKIIALLPYTEWENMKVNNDTVQLRYKGIIVKY